jgi:hypothetical protein
MGGDGTFSGLVVVEVLIELLRNPILLSPSAACNMPHTVCPRHKPLYYHHTNREYYFIVLVVL